jgi:dolichol kinase
MAGRELGRRLVHVAGGFPVGLYWLEWLTWVEVRWLYLAGLGLAIALEAMRLLVGVDWWIYDELTREYEQDNPAGYALYIVGAATVAFAFAPRIAIPAVLMLAIVDPVSGLLSVAERRPVKRPRVLAATFALAGAIALWFVPLPAALAGGALATAADGATPVIGGYVIDDNLGIPIGAGVAMWLAVQLPV